MNEVLFYDVGQSYEVNYGQGPFGAFAVTSPEVLPRTEQHTFLGYSVDIPFGIPAGPLLNSQFITAAWEEGFSLTTYKTVRGNEYPCHPYPNVIKIFSPNKDIHPGDMVHGELDMSTIDVTQDGITNSFGVPSKPPDIWQEDVSRALRAMKKGNLLILSFMGTKKEGMSRDEYIANFVATLQLARQTGAPVLEVNFSCPNVGREGLICNDIETSRDLLEAMKPVKGNVPLLVKIGYFAKEQQKDLEHLLEAIHANADGVVAINTIQAKVVDDKGGQILPGSPVRLYSGICGAAIRWAGLEMAQRIMAIKQQKGWKDFAVVGVGGVTAPDDYFAYMKLGVDAVQSATGAMWRPTLALEIREQLDK